MVSHMQLLKEWDLEQSVRRLRKNWFRYSYDLGDVDFVFLKDESEFPEIHNEIWCEDKTEFFLAIFENRIHICDSKTRPDSKHPLEKATIETFERNVKTQKYYHLFKRERIESGECMKEIQPLLNKRGMRTTVTEDVITNVILCRDRIAALLSDEKEGIETAGRIIEICLFIRILEDKSRRNNLRNVLGRKNPDEFSELIDSYSEIFHSTFKKGDIPGNITHSILGELESIFEDRSPGFRIPYKFGSMPITLLIHVHRRLKGKEKNPTPESVVNYITNKILNYISDLNQEITVLDFACQSGILLVTFLETLMQKREEHARLTLEKKFRMVENLYGLGGSCDDLRTAAFSLYLKAIEGEKPETVKALLTKKLFPRLHLEQGANCHGSCQEFDVIVGDLLSYSEGKLYSDYHPSQLLCLKKWMKRGALSGIIAPLSCFTHRSFNEFRKKFMEKYCLKSFADLSRIMPHQGGECACAVIFSTNPLYKVEFCTPHEDYFSKKTGIISDNKAEISLTNLKESDILWHLYVRGYHNYRRLQEFIDTANCQYLEDFVDVFDSDKAGEKEKEKEKERAELSTLSREEASRVYNALSKVCEDHYPVMDLKDIPPDSKKEGQDYIHFLNGKKLIIAKDWPIKASISSDTLPDDPNFWVCHLKMDCPVEYLLLFESILNSRFAEFYLEINHQVGDKSCPVDISHMKNFPVPDLEFNCTLVDEIIETAKSLKPIKPGLCRKKLRENLDRLIFVLYDLDYFDVKEIEQYYIEKGKEGDDSIRKKDMQKYCEEFIDTFNPFIKEELFLTPEWATSEIFGTMVRFSVSPRESPLQYNRELEEFVLLIESKTKCEKKDIFKEKKIKFYDNSQLYIYKSNKQRDWTEFMAIKDANEELHEYFRKLKK